MSRLKKDLPQEGHTNPNPKCTLHTCVQIVACEVDGPLCTAFNPVFVYSSDTPQLRTKGMNVGGRASSEAGDKASDAIPHLLLQDWRLQVQHLQAPEGVDGRCWQMESGKPS